MTAAPTFRFAPSPNGRLHLGHAYSALLNAALAASTGGRLLLRIEDIDLGRTRPDFVEGILSDLAWLGLAFDGPVLRQSERFELYAAARDALARRGLAYPCFCSRGEIAARGAALEAAGQPIPRDPDGAPLYPGTCRARPASDIACRMDAGALHTWRLDMAAALRAAPGPHRWHAFAPEDPLGEGRAVPAEPSRWGDAVIARRDVPTSYHLAVVLDDAAQGVTHVVRGQDLEAATDLHALLQALLGLPRPVYHHHALLRAPDGEKLAKSRGSEALADLLARGATPTEIRARLGFP